MSKIDFDLKTLSHLADSASQAELRVQTTAQRRVSLRNGELSINTRADFGGVSARVGENGYYGFSSSPTVSEVEAKKVLKAAKEQARFLSTRCFSEKSALPLLKKYEHKDTAVWMDAEQVYFYEICRRTDEYIVKNCPKLSARSVVAYADCMDKELIASGGVYSHSVQPRTYIYVFLTAPCADGGTVEVFDSFGGFGNPKELFEGEAESKIQVFIDELYKMALDKAEGIAPKAGRAQVIIDGKLAGMLAHEAVGHTVEADMVIGGSVAGHLLNKEVASSIVSLTDFAHTAFGNPAPLPVYLDDEGVRAKDVHIIENGILRAYMHNRESANKFGAVPRGNARAWLFSDEPLIRMRNTAIHPGKSKLEEMIASVEDGYYLLKTNNGQADSTGEFMFGISMGYEIKNGKLGRAIRDTTISGIAFEMLKTVDMLSDEMKWGSSGFCGKKQPMPTGLGGPALRCMLTIGGC